MTTQRTTFTLQRILSLALILAMMAGMLPASASSASTGSAAEASEADQITPGLQAAIDAALGPQPGMAADLIEEDILTASDGANSDSFGYSVAVDGDLALVAAHGDDDNGSNSGSVYLFERNDGGADSWGQVKKLTASDGAAEDRFGRSVALSGDTALVGADGDDDDGSSSGSAYIFERNNGGLDNWGEVAKLTASDGAASDYFGTSVALSGDTALVGAYHDDDNGSSSGSAYIFTRNQGGADNWGEAAKLTASDGAAYDEFGRSVALSGDAALVGAYGDEGFIGSAYLFERNNGGADNWGEVVKLTASDGAAADYFGNSVALSGDTALVGAFGDDDDGSESGSAYLFERNTGGADNWGEVVKLTASDGAADDYFGWSVALSGEAALVGANRDDDDGSNSGSAYLFERNSGGGDNWGQAAKLTASDGVADDEFGYAVALSGDTALVGALGGEGGSPRPGKAYVFTGRPEGWRLAAKPIASDGDTYDYFGSSVAVDGDLALVGAPWDDDNGADSGSAYLFERNQSGVDSWGPVKKLTASDAAAGDIFGWSVSLSGDLALVGARGDDDNGADSGSAYLFERNYGGADNWGEVFKLTASGGAADDYFGTSVALSGDTALVGARNDDGYQGSAYLFERNQGGADNWGQVKKLTASDAAATDEFGESVALDGDTALVGAHFNNSAQGSAYIFERNTGGLDNWGEVKKLTASDAAAGDEFGGAVALSGDTALVGATGDDGDIGSAYNFERNTGGVDNWGEVVKLTASDGAAGDYFGASVALSGEAALVGAFGDDDNGSMSGSAYFFTRNQGGSENWGQAAKITASDSAAYDMFGTSVALSGDTALVGAPGDDEQVSVPGAAYVFVGVPPGDDTIGTFDPATGNFLLRNTNDAGAADLDFLFAADITDGIPLGGDWDGDGADTIGVFSPSLGEFRLRNSNDAGVADITLQHNILKGEQPIVGDWNGDGTDTVGIFMDGKVYMRNTNSIAKPDIAFNFGSAGDIPLAGDWNGDGIDTIGVFDPVAGEFQLRNSNSGGVADITIQHKALKNRTPLAGDWDGDGVDTLGIYVKGKVLLRNTNTIGPPDLKFNYGGAGLLPVTGDWDGS